MCGRTALTVSPEDLRDALGLADVPVFAPRYNVTPSQPTAVVRGSGRLDWLQWGLVPHWAKDRKIANKLALARVETVWTTPSFRDAIKKRRCLVIVSGFYEWQRIGKTASTPFFIAREDRALLALAGIWERWISRDGEVLESCAILTQPARGPLEAVHDRMPVSIERPDWAAWLGPAASPDEIRALLALPPAVARIQPVGPYVNDPRHDDPECLVPREPAQGTLFPPPSSPPARRAAAQ
jgi:putative SOS response-associated peptidase YedK